MIYEGYSSAYTWMGGEFGRVDPVYKPGADSGGNVDLVDWAGLRGWF